jgi:RNA polymerase sigma-70 factor (ECF subfamily)
MSPLLLTDAAIERIEAEAGEIATVALDELPPDQREAVRARIVDERDYADIARTTRTSEAVVRKRVSRGLAGLRARVEENGT